MSNDLSLTSGPITDLFRVDSADGLRLSPEQITHFHTHGYVAGIRILSDEQIEHLREELAQLVDPSHDGADLWYE